MTDERIITQESISIYEAIKYALKELVSSDSRPAIIGHYILYRKDNFIVIPSCTPRLYRN